MQKHSLSPLRSAAGGGVFSPSREPRLLQIGDNIGPATPIVPDLDLENAPGLASPAHQAMSVYEENSPGEQSYSPMPEHLADAATLSPAAAALKRRPQTLRSETARIRIGTGDSIRTNSGATTTVVRRKSGLEVRVIPFALSSRRKSSFL